MALREIAARFAHHEMTDEEKTHSNKIREDAMNLADIIDIYCPESREKSLALTKLEECIMWVNKSISHN